MSEALSPTDSELEQVFSIIENDKKMFGKYHKHLKRLKFGIELLKKHHAEAAQELCEAFPVISLAKAEAEIKDITKLLAVL